MDVDEFWSLIEASRRRGSSRSERESFLRNRLWDGGPMWESSQRYPRLWSLFGEHWCD